MPGFAQASDLNAWSALQDHHQKLGKDIVLKEYFKKDPQVSAIANRQQACLSKSSVSKSSATLSRTMPRAPRSCSTSPRTSLQRRQ